MGNSHNTRLSEGGTDRHPTALLACSSRLLNRPVSDINLYRGKKSAAAAGQDCSAARSPVTRPRRTGSVRGYEPRSASLRRKRSIQRRSHLFGNGCSRRKTALDLEADLKMARDQKQLFEAAERGDVDAVEAIVDTGIDVNSTDENQMSVLHHAATHARDEVMKALISRGASVNATDVKGGFSPMHWVVINANPQFGSADHVDRSLVVLQKAGANVNCTDFNFATPLHIAAQKGDRECIKTLMRLGADPTLKDITGRDCFDVAKNSHVKAIIEQLKKTKEEAIYHVLEVTPLGRTPPPSYSPPPPPVITLPPLPAPKQQSPSQSSLEDEEYSEPFYHSPELFRTSTFAPSPPTTPPPPPPRRRKQQHPSYPIDSHIYHILEIPPAATRRRNSQKSLAPRRRKSSVRRL